MQVFDLCSQSVDDSLNRAWIIKTLHLYDLFKEFCSLKLTADVYWVDVFQSWLNKHDSEQRLQELGIELSLKLAVLKVQKVAEKVQEAIKESLTPYRLSIDFRC